MRNASVALAAALFSSAFAFAAAPDTPTPPASASKPATPLLLAETALKSFPGSANGLAGRPDARNLRIEGRVREIHAATLPGDKTETRLILVGNSQLDESPAHFTCHLDKLPDDVKVDQIIRIIGTAGPVTPAGDRVDLLNCHDVTIVGDPTVGNRLAGFWRCNSVIVDGAALRKDTILQGKKADDIPPTDFASPMNINLALKADGTLAAELWNAETLVRKVAGRWTLTKDDSDAARVKIDIAGNASFESTASIDNDRLKITLPGFSDKHILPDSPFEKVNGIQQTIDWKAMKNQAIAWFNAGNSMQQQPSQQGLTTLTNALDSAALHKNWFVGTFGADLLKRKKAVAVLAAFGKLTVLEFNDAQTQRDTALNRNHSFGFGEMPGWGTLMTPEVKVESIVFDKKGAVDPAQPITGKITLRSLRRVAPGKFALVMETQGLAASSVFDHPVQADSDTYNFRFEPLAAHVAPTAGATIAVVMFVGRQAGGGGCIVSEPILSLTDIAGR